MLWAVFTLIAAAAQTARNAMQRELTTTLGTVGATHVRFLFGFPFALLFLACVLAVTGVQMPSPPGTFWPWVLAGAFTQIAATATMLSVMGQRSFVVAYAYIKTEPVHVALFGLIFLGDKVTPLSAAAILIATVGVIVISLKPATNETRNIRSTVVGIFSGALFGLSAIGYRGAILSLNLPDFVVAATFTVTVGLVIQAAALSLYLALRGSKATVWTFPPAATASAPSVPALLKDAPSSERSTSTDFGGWIQLPSPRKTSIVTEETVAGAPRSTTASRSGPWKPIQSFP